MTKQTSSQINLRNLVLSMLEDVQSGKKSHLVLNKYLNDYITLDKKMRAFITRLFQGTLERQIEIDYIINSFSNTPIFKLYLDISLAIAFPTTPEPIIITSYNLSNLKSPLIRTKCVRNLFFTFYFILILVILH